MLFDLKGKRRRVVQATYLTLAVLMGGGLVLFGIGGDVQGGLFEAFSDRKGQTDGNEVVEKRIKRSEKAIAADSKDIDARKQLVRDYFQLANSKADKGGNFSASAKDDLAKSDENWRAYLRSDPKKVDEGLAGLALQLYDPNVLDKPKRARDAARALARESDDTTGYLRLVQYAALAKDKRTVSLATEKAVDLAPKKQRKLVRQQAKQFAKSAGQ